VVIIGLRSVYGTGIRRIGLFNADLAALSALSLPEMNFLPFKPYDIGSGKQEIGQQEELLQRLQPFIVINNDTAKIYQ